MIDTSTTADLERMAAELGKLKLPRHVRRITMAPDAAERLAAEMRLRGLEGIEVLSNAMLAHGDRKVIIEYTDGTVEMHVRGKVVPLGKRMRGLWPMRTNEANEDLRLLRRLERAQSGGE